MSCKGSLAIWNTDVYVQAGFLIIKPCILFVLDCRWCGPAPIGLGVPSTGVQICMCLALHGNRPPYWSATTPSSKK